jgi:hypothetical protein
VQQAGAAAAVFDEAERFCNGAVGFHVCTHAQVVGEASLELTLSQFWSSLGSSNIEVELSFHGLSVSPAAADTSSGAAVTNDTLLLDAAAGLLKVCVGLCLLVCFWTFPSAAVVVGQRKPNLTSQECLQLTQSCCAAACDSAS